jgi:NAD dependent epimerase/dehydratase family enzyme
MSQVVLASQRVVPDAAQRAGFVFEHPDIFTALAELARAA